MTLWEYVLTLGRFWYTRRNFGWSSDLHNFCNTSHITKNNSSNDWKYHDDYFDILQFLLIRDSFQDTFRFTQKFEEKKTLKFSSRMREVFPDKVFANINMLDILNMIIGI